MSAPSTSRPAPLRVATAQAESRPGDVEANVAAAVALVVEAARGGARVAVLPELFLTGYDPQTWHGGPALADVPAEDPRLAPLTEAAAQHQVVVVVGAAVDHTSGPLSGKRTISLLLADGRDGGRLDVAYDKQHLTAEEKPWFTPGRRGASLVVDGWELGLGVCYDGCFPEHARAAAEAGATAYLCPAAYYTGAEHRRDLYYAARALDNGIYVVLSDLTGTCGGRTFSGGSAVYDPQGRPVVRAGRERAVVYADLEPAEVEVARELNPMTTDRVEPSLLTERVRWEPLAGRVG
ncbi:MAG TPA: carbon-nitrogen hydrolase family protein [Nocardioidaceae bacterium]|jgi:predicted amidohydrolase|nr:carbon-nitrogen hydrolase family protein [Nocardioidaceae bacterium]